MKTPFNWKPLRLKDRQSYYIRGQWTLDIRGETEPATEYFREKRRKA